MRLETQIAQQATLLTRQPKTNHRKHYNVIITCSGKQLEEPQIKGMA